MSESDGATPPVIEPEKTRLISEHAFARPLTACYWDPKNRFIFVGSEDYGIHRFDLSDTAVTHFGSHDSWVRAIGMSPDGMVTYSGGYDGRLVWWPSDAATPEPIRVIDDAHEGWIRALAVSPDGRFLATCGNDHLVRLWDAESGATLRTFRSHESHVYNVAFSPDSMAIVSCDLKGFVKLWNTDVGVGAAVDAAQTDPPDVATSTELPRAEALFKYDPSFLADIGGARCMAFSIDGTRLALGGVTNVTNAFAGVGECAVVLLDLTQPKIALQFEAAEKVNGSAWGVIQHPQGFWIGLTGGTGGGWLYFWRDDKPAEFFKLNLKNDGRGLSMSPDNTRIAVAHADRHLRIYALFGE